MDKRLILFGLFLLISFTFVNAGVILKSATSTSSTVTIISNGTDTNESTRFNVLTGTDCGGTDKMIGVGANGAVVCSADITGAGAGNTTSEMWIVINNNTFMNINTKTGNTTGEIWTVIDNSTFIKLTDLPLANKTTISFKNITDMPTCSAGKNLFYNGSILNCTTGADTDTFNTTAQMWTVINNNTFMSITTKTGNTTSEIWTTINNGTFISFGDLPLANRTTVSFKNITDIPTCSGGTNLFFNGSNLNCTTNTGGVDTDTWNTTSQIWFVINNNTFMPIGTPTGNTTTEIRAVAIAVGTKLGNTSAEIWAIGNNNTYIPYTDLPLANRTTIAWQNITNLPTCGATSNLFFNGTHLNCTTSGGTDTFDTDTFNTTGEVWTVINNDTFIKNNTAGTWNITANKTNYWNDSLGMNTTQFTFINKIISLGETWLKGWADIYYITIGTKLGNTTSEIWAVGNNNTWMPIATKTGNTTGEIWTVADNSTWIKQTELPLANRTTIAWQNITNLPTCAVSSNLFYNGSHLNCTTGADTDTFNTTSQMWTVINNETFIRISNRSSEVWTVVNNNTFLNVASWNSTNSSYATWLANYSIGGYYLNWSTASNGTLMMATNWNSTNSSYATWLANYSVSGAYTNWSQVNNGSMMPVTGGNFTGNVNHTNSNITLSNSWIKNQTGQAYIYHNSSGWVIKG